MHTAYCLTNFSCTLKLHVLIIKNRYLESSIRKTQVVSQPPINQSNGLLVNYQLNVIHRNIKVSKQEHTECML